MKLVTAHSGSGTRLYVETIAGMLDVATASERLGLSVTRGVSDVGTLLRAGDEAMAEVEHIKGQHESMSDLVVTISSLNLAPPVVAPASIVCVGRNYAEHAAEGGAPVPQFPILFSKFPNTLVGSGHAVVSPRITKELDYEGELCAVIGKMARRVSESESLNYVAGYTIMNDISARDLQMNDVQWIRGKSLDTFAPLGPAFVTADEIGEVADLRIETRVNSELRQDASCADMIFALPALIAFITEGITLQPGDLVATGTPAGVGLGFKPPRYMSPGDLVDVTIAGIGTLHSSIVADEQGAS